MSFSSVTSPSAWAIAGVSKDLNEVCTGLPFPVMTQRWRPEWTVQGLVVNSYFGGNVSAMYAIWGLMIHYGTAQADDCMEQNRGRR